MHNQCLSIDSSVIYALSFIVEYSYPSFVSNLCRVYWPYHTAHVRWPWRYSLFLAFKMYDIIERDDLCYADQQEREKAKLIRAHMVQDDCLKDGPDSDQPS
jgi:hypothetical protein